MCLRSAGALSVAPRERDLSILVTQQRSYRYGALLVNAAVIWRAGLQAQADRIEDVLYGPPVSRAAGNFAMCTRTKRDHAFADLRRLLEGARG